MELTKEIVFLAIFLTISYLKFKFYYLIENAMYLFIASNNC